MYLGDKDFKTVSKLIEDKTAEASDLFWDWFCTNKQLAKQGESNYKKVKFIVDCLKINPEQVRIYFKNCCPVEGDLYDRIYIENINDEDKFICVTPKLGHVKCQDYKKCELYIYRTNQEVLYDNWVKFKSVIKNNEMLQKAIRKELAL